jgi:catalase
MQTEQDNNNEFDSILTNRQGHPVTDNQNTRTVGNRGPMTLENYDFLEK